jgi:hypothetical protein
MRKVSYIFYNNLLPFAEPESTKSRETEIERGAVIGKGKEYGPNHNKTQCSLKSIKLKERIAKTRLHKFGAKT